MQQRTIEWHAAAGTGMGVIYGLTILSIEYSVHTFYLKDHQELFTPDNFKLLGYLVFAGFLIGTTLGVLIRRWDNDASAHTKDHEHEHKQKNPYRLIFNSFAFVLQFRIFNPKEPQGANCKRTHNMFDEYESKEPTEQPSLWSRLRRAAVNAFQTNQTKLQKNEPNEHDRLVPANRAVIDAENGYGSLAETQALPHIAPMHPLGFGDDGQVAEVTKIASEGPKPGLSM